MGPKGPIGMTAHEVSRKVAGGRGPDHGPIGAGLNGQGAMVLPRHVKELVKAYFDMIRAATDDKTLDGAYTDVKTIRLGDVDVTIYVIHVTNADHDYDYHVYVFDVGNAAVLYEDEGELRLVRGMAFIDMTTATIRLTDGRRLRIHKEGDMAILGHDAATEAGPKAKRR